MLYKLFDIRQNVVFAAGGKNYVILNQEVEFQEVVLKCRYVPFGQVYKKPIDEFRKNIESGIVSYVGYCDRTPDDFNMVIGLIFFSIEQEKFFCVTGGGRKEGKDTTRFVETTKMYNGWERKDVVYTMFDEDIKKKQAENLLWFSGKFDPQIELI